MALLQRTRTSSQKNRHISVSGSSTDAAQMQHNAGVAASYFHIKKPSHPITNAHFSVLIADLQPVTAQKVELSGELTFGRPFTGRALL